MKPATDAPSDENLPTTLDLVEAHPASSAEDPVPADDPNADPAAGPARSPDSPAIGRGELIGQLALYTLLRFGLLALLTAAMMFFMPLIVALAFAVVLQLPLAMLLFGGPRRRVSAALAAASGHRRAERAKLRAALDGDGADPN